MIDKVTEKLGNSDGWLNFWRISVLGVLLGLSLWFNHLERKEHNIQTHELLTQLAECETQ